MKYTEQYDSYANNQFITLPNIGFEKYGDCTCSHEEAYVEEIVVKASPSNSGSVSKICNRCRKEFNKTIVSRITDVLVDKAVYHYAGTEIKPVPTVYDADNKVIDSKYYDCVYSELDEFGTGTVEVVFKGIYEGSKKANYVVQYDDCTVTFDYQGGSGDTVSKTVSPGWLYRELPTPTRTGYTFLGWYTDLNNGKRIQSDTRVALAQENHTLYAYWAKCVVNSVSVSLDGTVHLNIVFTAEGSLSSDSTAYIMVAGEKISLSSAAKNSDGTYTVSVEVAPKEYKKDIQITFGDSNGKCDGIYLAGADELLKVTDSVMHCSVSNYFTAILNGEYSESAKALAQKAMEYCECTGVYFGTVAGNDYEEGDNLGQYAVSSYASNVTDVASGAEYIGSSLVLDGTISIRHYFMISNAQNVSVKTDYQTNVLHKVADNVYYIEIANISANNFDRKYETVMSSNGGNITVKYSVMSYAYEVGRNMTDSKIRNLCASLYMYMNAAKAYQRQ